MSLHPKNSFIFFDGHKFRRLYHARVSANKPNLALAIPLNLFYKNPGEMQNKNKGVMLKLYKPMQTLHWKTPARLRCATELKISSGRQSPGKGNSVSLKNTKKRGRKKEKRGTTESCLTTFT